MTSLIAQAAPDFARARELAGEYTAPGNVHVNPKATELARHLTQALETIDRLRQTVADTDAEVTEARDRIHKVDLLCAGRPVVFSAHVRRELGLPYTAPVDYAPGSAR